MNILAVITAVLTLLAGIGVFLIACTMMSSNLESASSKRLKRLFAGTLSVSGYPDNYRMNLLEIGYCGLRKHHARP